MLLPILVFTSQFIHMLNKKWCTGTPMAFFYDVQAHPFKMDVYGSMLVLERGLRVWPAPKVKIPLLLSKNNSCKEYSLEQKQIRLIADTYSKLQVFGGKMSCLHPIRTCFFLTSTRLDATDTKYPPTGVSCQLGFLILLYYIWILFLSKYLSGVPVT